MYRTFHRVPTERSSPSNWFDGFSSGAPSILSFSKSGKFSYNFSHQSFRRVTWYESEEKKLYSRFLRVQQCCQLSLVKVTLIILTLTICIVLHFILMGFYTKPTLIHAMLLIYIRPNPKRFLIKYFLRFHFLFLCSIQHAIIHRLGWNKQINHLPFVWTWARVAVHQKWIGLKKKKVGRLKLYTPVRCRKHCVRTPLPRVSSQKGRGPNTVCILHALPTFAWTLSFTSFFHEPLSLLDTLHCVRVNMNLKRKVTEIWLFFWFLFCSRTRMCLKRPHQLWNWSNLFPKGN